MNIPQRERLEGVPEIVPATGLSRNYIRAFGRLNLFLRSLYEGKTTTRIKEFSKNNLLNYRFKKYQEWFKKDRFGDIVTEATRSKVARLDAIVEELNRLVSQGKIVELPQNGRPHRPTELFNEAMSMIIGLPDFDFQRICREGEVTRYLS